MSIDPRSYTYPQDILQNRIILITGASSGIGAALARRKRRVLLIDTDTQANVSISLGITDYGDTLSEVLLRKVKAERDAAAVEKALAAIADDCRADRNVMPGIIEAAKVYCTEQEVCDVFRDVFGQHQDRPEF